MQPGQRTLVIADCRYGVLSIIGEGTYLGEQELVDKRTGKQTFRKFDIIELDNGKFFYSCMAGVWGTKESVLSRYEGLYTETKTVPVSREFDYYIPVSIFNERKQEIMETSKHATTRKEPMIVFAKSKNGRVTIAGKIVSIDTVNKKFEVELGLAKQRISSDRVNRKKIARAVARGRAEKNPFTKVAINYRTTENSDYKAVVDTFRKVAEDMAERYANNLLPKDICDFYKMKYHE